MSDLKTLKDLDFVKRMQFEDSWHFIEFDTEDLKELKAEAVNWVKSDDWEKLNRKQIFMRFFNLTEEDLKEVQGE